MVAILDPAGEPILFVPSWDEGMALIRQGYVEDDEDVILIPEGSELKEEKHR